jgi:hypothetical protein
MLFFTYFWLVRPSREIRWSGRLGFVCKLGQDGQREEVRRNAGSFLATKQLSHRRPHLVDKGLTIVVSKFGRLLQSVPQLGEPRRERTNSTDRRGQYFVGLRQFPES